MTFAGFPLGIVVEPTTSVAAAVREAGIVLTATWSRKPFIVAGMLSSGAHITTLGPDEPGKAEVAAEIVRDALFICDDRELAVEMGALAGVGLGLNAIAAELGEVIGGAHPGRSTPEQVTVYGGAIPHRRFRMPDWNDQFDSRVSLVAARRPFGSYRVLSLLGARGIGEVIAPTSSASRTTTASSSR